MYVVIFHFMSAKGLTFVIVFGTIFVEGQIEGNIHTQTGGTVPATRTAVPNRHRHLDQTEGARLIVEGEYLIFRRYADPPDMVEEDLDMEVTHLMALTQRGKHFVRRGIDGYACLRNLPRLRTLHDERMLLDVHRLHTIDKTLRVLPADTGPETWAVIDDTLATMFARSLPGPHTITTRLRRLIATIDASVNFDPKKRRRREARSAPEAFFYPVTEDGELRSGMGPVADTATMACVEASLKETARTHKLGLADTILKLLTGDVSPSARPVLNIFSPKGDPTSMYLPGFGWASAEALETLRDLLDNDNDGSAARVVDLDDVADSEVGGYSPTPRMAAYVHARDGTCIYPGCQRPAESCQLDHRIPYGEGGPTTPENLFALCQKHHNQKTDRRSFYIPDPATGSIVWLFADGTWLIAESEGILHAHITPVNPRWASTISSNRATRAKTARFNAQCHTLCDRYEVGGDYEACVAGIRQLEKEHGLIFEFTPRKEER